MNRVAQNHARVLLRRFARVRSHNLSEQVNYTGKRNDTAYSCRFVKQVFRNIGVLVAQRALKWSEVILQASNQFLPSSEEQAKPCLLG